MAAEDKPPEEVKEEAVREENAVAKPVDEKAKGRGKTGEPKAKAAKAGPKAGGKEKPAEPELKIEEAEVEAVAVEEAVVPVEEKDKEVAAEEIEEEVILKEKLKTEFLAEKPKVREAEVEVVWKPRTQLGWDVYNGKIKSIEEVMTQASPILEAGLVDKLLPGLQEEIIDVGRVQRVTDSGRRMRFRIVAAVGNGDGYVGVGEAKGKEAGPTIRKGIERAKINIKNVKRGCGSWECGCGTPHTVPFKVTGKAGSVTVVLKPAPRGVGIVSGEIARMILSLAGIKDVWVTTEGHSRTGINFAHAMLNALENTNYVKLRGGDEEKLHIVTGQVKQPSSTEATG